MMEYYSALKRNKVLTPATTWRVLKHFMLSETGLTQRVTYCMILLYEMCRTDESIESRN